MMLMETAFSVPGATTLTVMASVKRSVINAMVGTLIVETVPAATRVTHSLTVNVTFDPTNYSIFLNYSFSSYTEEYP